jgi:CBS domain-containing protein
MDEQETTDKKAESGEPGGGVGRRDDVRGSRVFPLSGPLPESNPPIIPQPAWGQGDRGSAGYAESGGSNVTTPVGEPEFCRDIMTKNPVCCCASDLVETVARLMRDHDIGAVPVVEDMQSKKLEAIVTDRDIAIRGVAEGRDLHTTKIEQIMTCEVVTCSPDYDIQTCVDVMEAEQVRRVPAVDNSSRVVGIVAQGDIALRVSEPAQTGEVVRHISKPRAPAAPPPPPVPAR